jgi:hypothetical protein
MHQHRQGACGVVVECSEGGPWYISATSLNAVWNQFLEEMSASGNVVIHFVKQDGVTSANDDMVKIARSHCNPLLYNVTVKHFNAANPFKMQLSYGDMLTYVDNLLWVGSSDETDDHTCIHDIQYDIPGFPSIMVSVDSMHYSDTAYDTFMEALKFWAATI